jgi:hypothetical protein
MQPEGKLIGMASIRTIIFNPFILKNLEAELHSNETFMGRYFIYEKGNPPPPKNPFKYFIISISIITFKSRPMILITLMKTRKYVSKNH